MSHGHCGIVKAVPQSLGAAVAAPPAAATEYEIVNDATLELLARTAVSLTRAGIDIMMKVRLRIHDRYNWDNGKSVQLAGLTIPDTMLGRMHQVGVAQEFDVDGESAWRTSSWRISAWKQGAAKKTAEKTEKKGK